MRFDRKKSRELCAEIEAQHKECYRNAVLCLPHLIGNVDEGIYVEGYVFDRALGLPMAFEHGWVEWRGRVVDATPSFVDGKGVYFPGKRWTLDEVLAELKNTDVNDTLPLSGVVWGRDPAMREAYMKAQRRALGAKAFRQLQAFYKEHYKEHPVAG